MSEAIRIRRYSIPEKDRVLKAYFLNTSLLSCIMGPLGGGKTLAGLQRCMKFARLQEPHPIDRMRRTRWASIRGTYRDLERTHIRDWKEWWPPDLPYGEWRGGGNGEPGSHRLLIPLADGTTIDFEILFVAVGETSIEEVADGWPLTGFHIGGADALPEELYFTLLQRAGRYPKVDRDVGFKGATWKGGWLDCNAPNYNNHIDRNFISSTKEGMAFFRQPGGLDPDAENLQNLIGGRKYYLDMAKILPANDKRRKIDNLLGFDRSGKPVYPEYNPFKHYSKIDLDPVRGLKLVCGLDQGRSPAAVFGQRTRQGQLRFLRELVMTNVGPSEFGRMLRDYAAEQFPGFDITYVADPAAFNPTDTSESDDDVWAMMVEASLDATIAPARSNKRAMRENAIRQHMLASIDVENERLVVSNSMAMVHAGLNQMFRFRKVSASGQPERYASEIEKNEWSHPCEAAEYCAMELMATHEIMGRAPVSRVSDDRSDVSYRPVGM